MTDLAKEKDVIMWHLLEVEKETVLSIASNTGYKVSLINSIRTGRAKMTDKLRLALAKNYPSLVAYLLYGNLPKLPASKWIFAYISQKTNDGLEEISEKTGFKIGVIRKMFDGRLNITKKFLVRAIEVYPAIFYGDENLVNLNAPSYVARLKIEIERTLDEYPPS